MGLSAASQSTVIHLQAAPVATNLHTLNTVSFQPTGLMPIAPHSVALCPLRPHSSARPSRLSKIFQPHRAPAVLQAGMPLAPQQPGSFSPCLPSLCLAMLSWSSGPDAMVSTSVKSSFPTMSSSSFSRVRDELLRAGSGAQVYLLVSSRFPHSKNPRNERMRE